MQTWPRLHVPHWSMRDGEWCWHWAKNSASTWKCTIDGEISPKRALPLAKWRQTPSGDPQVPNLPRCCLMRCVGLEISGSLLWQYSCQRVWRVPEKCSYKRRKVSTHSGRICRELLNSCFRRRRLWKTGKAHFKLENNLFIRLNLGSRARFNLTGFSSLLC